MNSLYCKIISTGAYLPKQRVTNEELPSLSKPAAKLIEQKTGIRERRYADDGECTSDISAKAAKDCIEKSGRDPEGIDAIVLATSSPDSPQPQTAARVQHLIGAKNAFAMDINAVCSGALYAFHVADCMIRSGSCENVLVIGADIYSRYLNRADFSTYPYFGDGAGAVLMVKSETPGVIETVLHTDGSGADVIEVPGGGTKIPCGASENSADYFFKMRGREVYEFAVKRGAEAIMEVLSKSCIKPEDVSHIVSHQANINILRALSESTGIPMEKFAVTLDKYGNTAAASIPIALDHIWPECGEGDIVLLAAFGGGLSWGASLLRI